MSGKSIFFRLRRESVKDSRGVSDRNAIRYMGQGWPAL